MGSALNFAEMKVIFLVLVTIVAAVPEATGTPHLLFDKCNNLVKHYHCSTCSGSGSAGLSGYAAGKKKGKQLPGFAKDTFSIKKASSNLDPFFKAKFQCT